MPNPFTWLTMDQAVKALQGRLANVQFWTVTELQIYLTEALRVWNALTEQWVQDFVFNPSTSTSWNNLGILAASPRLRTVTDAQLYTQMQYMLLEQPSGAGTWTGTSQYSLAALQMALQKRRDEMIQSSGCNLAYIPQLATTPNTRRNLLPDTVLEPQRIRFIPSPGSGYGSPVTLTREDTQAFQYFDSDYMQESRVPASWSVSSEPPLAFDVDTAPNVPGFYDMVYLQSGPTFSPPNATLLGVPDDWSWVLMYGALADLLGRESEATDTSRSTYCLKRYNDGLEMMRNSNWLVQASINGFPSDTPSLFEMDRYTPEWQGNTDLWPTVINAGMDFLGVTSSTSLQSVNVTLVGNQPIPPTLADFVQISRDQFDIVLSYAQRLASLKMGGAEWAATEGMELDFYKAAAETNKRLLTYGLYTDILHLQGNRQNELVPR